MTSHCFSQGRNKYVQKWKSRRQLREKATAQGEVVLFPGAAPLQGQCTVFLTSPVSNTGSLQSHLTPLLLCPTCQAMQAPAHSPLQPSQQKGEQHYTPEDLKNKLTEPQRQIYMNFVLREHLASNFKLETFNPVPINKKIIHPC